eukprot:SAG25_NODE_362_length_9148_cov_2.742513_2_plen_227_part_00
MARVGGFAATTALTPRHRSNSTCSCASAVSPIPVSRATALGKAPFRITALPHYRITALPHYRITALPHYRITALPHYRITALPHYLKKRRHSRLLPTRRGKEVTAQEGFLWPELLLLTCFDSRGRSAVDLCLAFSESRKDRMSEFLLLDLRGYAALRSGQIWPHAHRKRAAAIAAARAPRMSASPLAPRTAHRPYLPRTAHHPRRRGRTSRADDVARGSWLVARGL